jgi:23S rRNA (uracil1939-C5)-methyltransferase
VPLHWEKELSITSAPFVQNTFLSTKESENDNRSTNHRQDMKEFSTCSICSGCPVSGDFPAIWPAICSFLGRPVPLIQGERVGSRLKGKLAIRGTSASPRLGLFREGSHEVIDIPDCPSHHPAINAAAKRIREEIAALLIEPYDEATQRGSLRYAQFFVSRENGKVQLVLVSRSLNEAQNLAEALWKRNDLWHSIWINIQPDPTNQILGKEWHHCCGEPFLWQRMGRAQIALHPGAFSQANLPLFDRMLDRIEEWVPQGAHLLEVYAGAGGISLHLASRLASAVLVENNPYAALSYRESAKEPAFRYIQAEAKEAAALIDEADCILVDPPRKGLDRKILEGLKSAKGKTLIYISCAFKSFQSDAKELLEAGWQIDDAALYWLFPGTDHVEIAAKWKKNLGERI